MKAFLTQSLLVTESTLFWVVVLLTASAIIFLAMLWERALHQDKRQWLQSLAFPTFRIFPGS